MLEKYNSNSTCKLIYKQKEKGEKMGEKCLFVRNSEQRKGTIH